MKSGQKLFNLCPLDNYTLYNMCMRDGYFTTIFFETPLLYFTT